MDSAPDAGARLQDGEAPEEVEQAGWSIGDVALRGEGGGLIWIVLGRCSADLHGQRRDAP
jgi:hypothetical protein